MVKILSLLSAALLATIISAETVYTGEIIDKVKVANKIDINDLPEHTHTRLWLEMPRSHNGQSWHLPVLITKGSNEGKRVFLNSGTYGNSLNGIRAVQKVLNDVDPKKVKGAVVGIPGLNMNGMLLNKHRWFSQSGPGSLIDLNQYFPGSTEGDDIDQFLASLWENLIINNKFNAAVDFQSLANGNASPIFAHADTNVTYVNKMVELSGVDVVINKPGDPKSGNLDDTLNAAGVPTITFQLGNPRLFELGVIQKAYDKPHITDAKYIRANSGGLVDVIVELNQVVQQDQVVGTMYDPHGDVVEIYKAPVKGKVFAFNSDPLREPGSLIVAIAVM
ncbi:hypothetical protein BB561_004147 [Smittium simulii]|uniref:Succinylglutamate desuccinylase/Aspartoacylase catalytic domain-containing protein n=1 Tax=Smittium simulii TaxID=133385 RepID=A0A2T9YHU5_9FUNG|nr:hypothetical protein BB561_004147 [Smittium simulii]